MVQRLRESDNPCFEELSTDIDALLASSGDMGISLCALAMGGNVEVFLCSN